MKRQRQRAVGIVALAGGVALVCALSVLFADRTGLYCLSYGPNGPPTLADGPIAMNTDASVYTPDTRINITTTNHTDGPIYLFPVTIAYMANCSADIEVQRREPGGWKPVTMGRCWNSEMVPLYSGYVVRLAPGEAYSLLVDHSQLKLDGVPDPLATPGTYRVSMSYLPESALPTQDRGRPERFVYFGYQLDSLVRYLRLHPTAAMGIVSAPFNVCICARCE